MRFEVGDRVEVRSRVLDCGGRVRLMRPLLQDHLMPYGMGQFLHGEHSLREPGMTLVVDKIDPSQETGHVVWAASRRGDGVLLWRDCFKPEELRNLSRGEE
jgi:hypothetical protein